MIAPGIRAEVWEVSKGAEYRRERIERLLHELKYEITRGMMEREIEEEMGFRFIVPVTKHFKTGVVMCEFRTQPVPNYLGLGDDNPRLKLVGGEQ